MKKKLQSEESLRKDCVEYAIAISQSLHSIDCRPLVNPIDLADIIFNYIKNGKIDEHLKDSKLY